MRAIVSGSDHQTAVTTAPIPFTETCFLAILVGGLGLCVPNLAYKPVQKREKRITNTSLLFTFNDKIVSACDRHGGAQPPRLGLIALFR